MLHEGNNVRYAIDDLDEEFLYLRAMLDDAEGSYVSVAKRWPLAEVASWIQERKVEAVDGNCIRAMELSQTLYQIHRALQSGDLIAFGQYGAEPTVRPIPKETWDVYRLDFEVFAKRLICIQVILNDGEWPSEDLSYILMDRDQVQLLWSPHGGTSLPKTTAAAETECMGWLRDLIGASPDQPSPKGQLFAEAKRRFPRLSKHGFGRVWNRTIKEMGAAAWSRPGRRPAKPRSP